MMRHVGQLCRLSSVVHELEVRDGYHVRSRGGQVLTRVSQNSMAQLPLRESVDAVVGRVGPRCYRSGRGYGQFNGTPRHSASSRIHTLHAAPKITLAKIALTNRDPSASLSGLQAEPQTIQDFKRWDPGNSRAIDLAPLQLSRRRKGTLLLEGA